MGLMVQDLFLVHVVIGFSEDRINILDGRDSQCEAKGNANLGQAELFVQLCMDLFRLFFILHFPDHEELIAAHAEDGIRRAALAEDICCRLQEAVAGFMAELIVHLLEPVEITEEEGILVS